MNVRTREGLQAMAKRGGTAAERERATHALKNGGLYVRESEQSNLATIEDAIVDTITAQGVLTLTHKGVNTYLRQSSLEYFLSHIRDGEKFNLRTVGVNLSFGQSDFYVILRWLKSLKDVLVKTTGGYIVNSVQTIKDAWNSLVREKMVLN